MAEQVFGSGPGGLIVLLGATVMSPAAHGRVGSHLFPLWVKHRGGCRAKLRLHGSKWPQPSPSAGANTKVQPEMASPTSSGAARPHLKEGQ